MNKSNLGCNNIDWDEYGEQFRIEFEKALERNILQIEGDVEDAKGFQERHEESANKVNKKAKCLPEGDKKNTLKKRIADMRKDLKVQR